MKNSVLDIINEMVGEGHFDKVVTKEELMYDRKLWNEEVLTKGGISYYYPETKIGGEVNTDIKSRYRVAKTYKGRFNEEQHTKKLKYKVRTADGEIFSVAAKTQAESQYVVDCIFGKGQYRVSQMME